MLAIKRDKLTMGEKMSATGSDSNSEETSNPPKKMRPCPECKKLAIEKYHPFCSKRCADVDLSRWFNGSYAIPVAEEDPSAEEFGRDI